MYQPVENNGQRTTPINREIGDCRTWFSIAWKDLLIDSAIASPRTGESVDRYVSSHLELPHHLTRMPAKSPLRTRARAHDLDLDLVQTVVLSKQFGGNNSSRAAIASKLHWAQLELHVLRSPKIMQVF